MQRPTTRSHRKTFVVVFYLHRLVLWCPVVEVDKGNRGRGRCIKAAIKGSHCAVVLQDFCSRIPKEVGWTRRGKEGKGASL